MSIRQRLMRPSCQRSNDVVRRNTLLVALAGIILLTLACATTTTTTSTVWSEPSEGQVRLGHVEWIREIVQRTEGDPALGAAAGAVVGGVLGGLITGRSSGTVVGAATGAIIGASESQGHREDRLYEVSVRFDDGETHVFRYWGYPPFRPGQAVMLTSRGLMGRRNFIASPPSESEVPPTRPESSTSATAPSIPQPEETPPPPPQVDFPVAESTVAPRSVPAGQWSFTRQYGWLWMPYGAAYTFTPHYENGDPYMFVYYPRTGWTWVEAPWLWGWGPRPYFGVGAAVNFSWYGSGWGRDWHGGHRPVHYHYARPRRSVGHPH